MKLNTIISQRVNKNKRCLERLQDQFEKEGRYFLCSIKSFINYSVTEHKHNIEDDRYRYFFIKYINCDINVLIYCRYHGFYPQKPDGHKNEHRGCPECYGNVKYTYDQVSRIYQQKCLILLEEDINGNKTKAETKCLICDHIWNPQISSVINQNTGCPICARKRTAEKQKFTYDFVKKEAEIQGMFLLTQHYENSYSQKLHIKCKTCSKERYTVFGTFYRNKTGCLNCRSIYRYDINSVKEYAKEIDVEILENEYISYKKKMQVKCLCCDNIWPASLDTLKSGSNCPECSRKVSKGEKYVATYLKDKAIVYIFQKKYHDLKDENKLSFDFYAINSNLLIEYDGSQHFSSDYIFYQSIHDFFDRINKDNIKNNYIFANNLSLLRLSYFCKKDDVSYIHDKIFSKIKTYSYLRFHVTKMTYISLKKKSNILTIKIKIGNEILTNKKINVFNVYRNAIKNILDTNQINYSNEIFTAETTLGKKELIINVN